MAYRAHYSRRLGGGPPASEQFPVDSAETFVKSAVVYRDIGGGEDNIKVQSGDGVLAVGLALHGAADGVESGKVLVCLATPDTLFRMPCSSAPAEANVGVEYGLTYGTGGIPTVDFTDTTYKLVRVVRVMGDADATVEVLFLASVSQADAIAS